MPWDNKNSGGPWGNRGGGGGKQPPNLDDLMKLFNGDRFKKFGKDGKFFGLLALLLVAMFWLSTGVYKVQEGELGTEILFGRFSGTTPAGLHFWWPSPFGDVIVIKVSQINRVDSGVKVKSGVALSGEDAESLMLTGDENIVSVNFTVLWSIKKVEDYLFNDPDPNKTVKFAAESAVREIVGRTPIVYALTKGRGEIADDAQKLLQQMVDDYRIGIQIQEVRLQKVDPPVQVIDAFRDVQRARADRESSINEARAYSNTIVPEARGTATQTTQRAEAYKQAVVAAAQGEADRFTSIYQQYQLAPEVTRKRMYIDSMKKILKDANKIIVDGKTQGILPYLPLDSLKPRQAEQAEESK